MKGCLGSNKVLKHLSDTRWSARTDAVDAQQKSYRQISIALESIAEDKNNLGKLETKLRVWQQK